MAKIKQTVKRRVRKVGNGSVYKQCNICHGTGRVKKK